MKINYQTKLDELTGSLTYKPSLLLHSCCGPCSSYVTEYLAKYFDIYLFFFNPNIYPESEYIKRLDTQSKWLDRTDYAKLIEGDYDHKVFLDAVRGLENKPEGGGRCTKCFILRLEETARVAALGGYKYFGTTLTVSPHKNAELINDLGETLAKKYRVKWLPSDFKKREGYKRSIELSREYELYRQNYCGCEFSLGED